MGYNGILSTVFQEWRVRLVTDFDATMRELLAIDRKAITLRSYMIGRFERELPHGTDRDQ
jgi:hypothetical protein